ncbi:hypothetical protein AB0M20_41280 [Actinoplanes sp. NPDC051633]|uniref:hypothetical protein n=1 Tax=Actinoplanes sp. NPDC051633 TaxID=3155670 RepID=UPI00341530DA
MSSRPKSDKGTVIGGVVSLIGVLIAVGAWLHPFSADEPADSGRTDSPAVIDTPAVEETPSVTTGPTGKPAVDPAPTPADCSTIADFVDRKRCVDQERNEAAQDVIDDFE